jgi:uncharacterized protein YggE
VEAALANPPAPRLFCVQEAPMENIIDTLQGSLPRTVTSRGEGMVEVAPDAARISVGIAVSRPSVKKARAEAASQAAAIVAALQEAGVPAREMQTSGYTVHPQWSAAARGKPAAIVAYDVRNTISAIVRDLERLPEVLDAATLAGANEVSGPLFFIQHPEEHEDEARRLAIASARRRAEVLAAATGATLGQVRSIVDGQAHRPAPRMAFQARTAVMDAPTPIEAGTEQITANVEVIWDLV